MIFLLLHNHESDAKEMARPKAAKGRAKRNDLKRDNQVEWRESQSLNMNGNGVTN
jgi:hypothetical protein